MQISIDVNTVLAKNHIKNICIIGSSVAISKRKKIRINHRPGSTSQHSCPSFLLLDEKIHYLLTCFTIDYVHGVNLLLDVRMRGGTIFLFSLQDNIQIILI